MDHPGQPIDAYSDAELLRLAQWIRSDDILRLQDELLQEMMNELGFQRRGKNVVHRLTTAITQSASNTPGHHNPPRWLQAQARGYRAGRYSLRKQRMLAKKVNTRTTRTRRR